MVGTAVDSAFSSIHNAPRRLWRVAGAATLALVLLASNLSAYSAAAAPANSRQPESVARSLPTASNRLVVFKRYGAALRSAPSSNSHTYYVMGCGGIMSSIAYSGGWYHVITDDGQTGWVGSARVAFVDRNPAFSCVNAVTFQMGSHVYTHVATGCLSLRTTPSRQAKYPYCVANGHVYEITNGPIEVAGEDWFGVWSSSTGSGWSLAQYLRAM